MNRGLPPSILQSAVNYLVQASARAEASGEFDDEEGRQARMMELCDRMDAVYFSDYPPDERARARHEVLCKAAGLCELALAQLRTTLADEAPAH